MANDLVDGVWFRRILRAAWVPDVLCGTEHPMRKSIEELPLIEDAEGRSYSEARLSQEVALEVLELGDLAVEVEVALQLGDLLFVALAHVMLVELTQLLVAVDPDLMLFGSILDLGDGVPDLVGLADGSDLVAPLAVLGVLELLTLAAFDLVDIVRHLADEVELLLVPGVPVDLEDGPRDDAGVDLGELVLDDLHLLMVEWAARDVEVDAVTAVLGHVIERVVDIAYVDAVLVEDPHNAR